MHTVMRDVYTELAFLQTALTVVRVGLSSIAFVIMRLKRPEWFDTVMPDGSLMPTPRRDTNLEDGESEMSERIFTDKAAGTPILGEGVRPTFVFEVMKWVDKAPWQPWLKMVRSDDTISDHYEELLMRETSSIDSSSADGVNDEEGEETNTTDSEDDRSQPNQASFVGLSEPISNMSTPVEVGVVRDSTPSSANRVSAREPIEEILGTVRVLNVDGYGAATVSTGAALDAVLAEAARQGYNIVHHYYDHDNTNNGP